MRFASPYALSLLLVVPILLALRQRQPYTVAVHYSSIADLTALSPSLATRLRWVLPLLRTLVLVLCILALARPQRGLEAIKVYSEGIAILMVVDISGSMAALDLQVDGRQSSRLDAVKQTFRTFVQGGGRHNLTGRDGDLIGMVTFARYPDGVCPLTLDHDTLLSLLDQVEIVTLPDEDGTAIGEALALGVERLKDSTAKSRVMILLTDGVNNAGDTEPRQAAQIARALGIKIYTIGAGTRGVAMVPARSPSGQMVLQRMRVDIDEALLSEIATRTGGQYFRATDGAVLQAIYCEIARLEQSPNVTEQYRHYAEIFPLFLIPGLGCLVLELVLANTRFRKIP
jgi:Ca-activated chloride channel family protein